MSAKKKNSLSDGKPLRKKAASRKATELPADVGPVSPPPAQGTEATTTQVAMPANSGVNDRSPSPSPDRAKVVELATQMISAQIVAISNHQTMTATIQHLQRLLIDLTDALSRSGSEGLDFRQVMVGLKGAVLRMQSPEDWLTRRGFLDPLGNNDLDDLFMSAMHRAERLLAAPESDTQIIFAEQIFEPKERLSEHQIFKRFNEYEWPNLGSRPSVIDLMTKVDGWFASSFEKGPKSAPVRQAEDHRRQEQKEASVLIRAMRLCQQIGATEGHFFKPQYRDVADAIGALLQARNVKSLDQLPNALGHYEHQKLIIMMFGGSAPTARAKDETFEPKQGKRKSPPREYRPWAVFRYLRRFGADGADELGLELNQKLQAPRQRLAPAHTPDIRGIIPEEFEFGPLGKEVEDFFAEQDAEWAEDYLAEQLPEDEPEDSEPPGGCTEPDAASADDQSVV